MVLWVINIPESNNKQAPFIHFIFLPFHLGCLAREHPFFSIRLKMCAMKFKIIS